MTASPIEVTACRVTLNPQANDRLKAFASIVLNDAFAVCDLKVIQGHEHLFVAMPSRRRRDGKFHDIAHPINHELRDVIEQRVLIAYEERMNAPPDDLAPIASETTEAVLSES